MFIYVLVYRNDLMRMIFHTSKVSIHIIINLTVP